MMDTFVENGCTENGCAIGSIESFGTCTVVAEACNDAPDGVEIAHARLTESVVSSANQKKKRGEKKEKIKEERK